MPTQVEQKAVDPEAELSNTQRMFEKLMPMCSVAKRAGGVPQLAMQEKQMQILKTEMKDTLLCIKLATKGVHAARDNNIKEGINKNITEFETFNAELRDEKAQQAELELLNYLAGKKVADLLKKVPTEADEMAMLENANNKLRRMENRLDLVTKRFCMVNTDNRRIREEIHRLLVERDSFNKFWNRTIGRLMKGKEYLTDILEIATAVFGERDECCRKLETLKWRGLQQLNKDISEMQAYEGELNHLAKLEEYLRVKGSVRICEAEEMEEMKRLEEIARCEQEIARYDALIEDILNYIGTQNVPTVIRTFRNREINNFSLFTLLLEVLQECILLKSKLEQSRQQILDQRDINLGRADSEEKKLGILMDKLNEQRENTVMKLNQNNSAEVTFERVLKGIDDLVRLAKCDYTPLLTLLGNHKEVTIWNVTKFLKILELEIKSLIQVAYGAVKPPAPTPKGRKAEPAKLVADPFFEILRPNRIEKLVPYQPCAYCVEDYMMNQVFETPAVPAEQEEVLRYFHLEDVNTKFGIFSLTVPSKRHPFRSKKD